MRHLHYQVHPMCLSFVQSQFHTSQDHKEVFNVIHEVKYLYEN